MTQTFRSNGTGGPGPAEMAEAFRDLPYFVLLESSADAVGDASFSYLAADPFLIFRAKGREIEIISGGVMTTQHGDPFMVLRSILSQYSERRVPGLPPFQGGAVGYIAYEAGSHIERLPRGAIDDLGLPEFYFCLYDWTVSFDHASGESWIVAAGLERLHGIEQRIQTVSPTPERLPEIHVGGAESNFSRELYVATVARIQEYILAGEIYQANLSQRFKLDAGPTRPWDIYRKLRVTSPAPFAAFLEYPEATVVSASPEEFLRVQDGMVQTRPMKGTRPRGSTADEDDLLADDLRSSEKDRAENLMIVDLMRNDLGKVCTPGTIDVTNLFAIERYSTVIQMVSTIQGELAPGVDAIDLLRACFPGGSVTGAPKIRAEEIIDELEPHQRSIYCGAIGYIGFDGSMLTSIPIRTLIIKDGTIYCPVGGAVVFDSEPEDEYMETLHKARGAFQALGATLD